MMGVEITFLFQIGGFVNMVFGGFVYKNFWILRKIFVKSAKMADVTI